MMGTLGRKWPGRYRVESRAAAVPRIGMLEELIPLHGLVHVRPAAARRSWPGWPGNARPESRGGRRSSPPATGVRKLVRAYLTRSTLHDHIASGVGGALGLLSRG